MPPERSPVPASGGSATAPAARELLRQSEERFRLLVESVVDYAIFLLDPQGNVATWNAGAQRIKGYSADEIIGQHFSRFYPPEDREKGVPQQILRTAEREGHCQVEGWRLRQDGTRFWADVTVTALRGAGGVLIGFAKVTRDLTERHAADEALRQSEERFRALVEGVVDYAIYMLDAEGHVSSWNAGAQRIKGYVEEEIVGQHFSRFYTLQDREDGKPERVLEEARRTGRFEEEAWRVRKDGSRFWASVVITALRDGEGRLRGFSKVTRDLTAHREAERERQQRIAAEEVARLRGEFLSVAAHELKTPITALRGRAQLTLRRYRRDGDLPKEQVIDALEVIDGQSSKIARLVEQLLDISRLEGGHLVLERQDTDLVVLTRGVVGMFRGREDGSRIQLEVPDQAVHAFVDSLRIEQVLTNLVDNALKYSPPSSPVRVTVTGDGAGELGRARVTVADEGPGVPEEDRPRLFDRFFRSSTTAATAGMGLGLYVSRQIVELHGGTIQASFPPEGGTRMTVELQTGSPDASTVRPEPVEGQPGAQAPG